MSLIDYGLCDIVEILERSSKKHDTFAVLLLGPLNSCVMMPKNSAKKPRGGGDLPVTVVPVVPAVVTYC